MSSLRHRLEGGARSATPRHDFAQVKRRLHQGVLDAVDVSRLQHMASDELARELRSVIEQLIHEDAAVLGEQDRRALVREIQWEMTGFGPIEPLLADPTVSDILINTSAQIYVERGGKLQLTDIRFNDEAHLMRIIEKIVSQVGRRIDESSPMVDARLPDGSRVNAIIPPLAIDGAIMSIRRFSATPLRMADLLRFKALTEPMAATLEALSRAKVNLVISGGTGSGKTTLLNILSSGIDEGERIITIEDAAELRLQQPHVVRLETRPANLEGRGEVSQRSLVKNALRMRPDRIILGEVRGAEAFDMLQAMNTGHEGSMATIHANTPRDALARLENMISMAQMSLTPRAVRQQIASAVTAIVQAVRLPDGKRKITSLLELVGMEGDTISTQEIFAFHQTGMNSERGVEGYFAASGVRPRFIERLQQFGLSLPDHFFDPVRRL